MTVRQLMLRLSGLDQEAEVVVHSRTHTNLVIELDVVTVKRSNLGRAVVIIEATD